MVVIRRNGGFLLVDNKNIIGRNIEISNILDLEIRAFSLNECQSR